MNGLKNPNIEYQNPKKEENQVFIFGFRYLDFGFGTVGIQPET